MNERADPRLLEFVVYLVSCARLSLEEPEIYGSFRLVEGAARILDIAGELGLAVDNVLCSARESIEREKLRMIDDHEGYRAWLDELLRDLVTEASRQNLADTA